MADIQLAYGVTPGTLSGTANVAQLFKCPGNTRGVSVFATTAALKFFFGVQGIADGANVAASSAYIEIPAGGSITLDVTREEFGHQATFCLASATTTAPYKVAPHAKGL